jgi:hypothetical protein
MAKQAKLETLSPSKQSVAETRSMIEQMTGVDFASDNQSLREYIEALPTTAFENMALFERTWNFSRFNVRQSAIWGNLMYKIGEEYPILQRYTSMYMRFHTNRATAGGVIEETHTNVRKSINLSNMVASDILSTFFDDVESAYYEINIRRVFPHTMKPDDALLVMTDLSSVNSFVNSLIVLDETSFQVEVTQRVQQMFANYYLTNQIPIIRLNEHPLDSEQACKLFITHMVTIAREFTSAINTDFAIINRSALTGTPDKPLRKIISERPPIVHLAIEHIVWIQVAEALTLYFGEEFVSGIQNQEWARNLIPYVSRHFPTTIESLDIDERTDRVTVGTDGFTDYERANLAVVADAMALGYTGELARPEDVLLGFMFDDQLILFNTLYDHFGEWTNIMTRSFQRARHFGMYLYLGVFRNVVALTAPPSTTGIINLEVQP